MPRSFLVKKLRCFTHHSDYDSERSCRTIPDVLPSPEATGLDLRIHRRTESVESNESGKENEDTVQLKKPVKDFVPLRIPQLSYLNQSVNQPPDILTRELQLKQTDWDSPAPATSADKTSDHDSYSPYSPVSSYSPRSNSPHSDVYSSPQLYTASFTDYYKRYQSPQRSETRSPQQYPPVDRDVGGSPMGRLDSPLRGSGSPTRQLQTSKARVVNPSYVRHNISPLSEYQVSSSSYRASPDYHSLKEFANSGSPSTNERCKSPVSESGMPCSDTESQEFQKGVTVGYTYDAFFITDGRSKRSKVDPAIKLSKQRYVCSECGKDYATSSNLSRHKQTHRSLDSQLAKKCPHCEKRYVSMPALSMHILTHELKHVCPVCDKKFSRPWLLQGHLRSHSGEKPFGCAHCGKAFADRSNLRAHMQTHSKYKSHECPRCHKSFALKSYLNKHLESACLRDSESGSSDEGIEMVMSPESQSESMNISY